MSSEKLTTTQTLLDLKSNPTVIIKKLANVTKEIALASENMPSMSKLCREHGEEKVESVVAAMIYDTSSFVGDEMTPDKCKITAIEIMNTYPYRSLKLEEIYIICRDIKSSEKYGKLTPSKMMTAVKNFWKDREKRAIRSSIDNSQARKGDTSLDKRIAADPRFAESINKMESRNRSINQKFLK
ncbi:hypothetical protein EZY14_016385 [Kordia sp. TARA_039_SRF]|nr:hypothetical protein EZY14_016385 [Kordia sp. TARA_039_SRF]